MVTSTSGQPDQPELEEPEPLAGGLNSASDTITLTVLPLSTRSAPALAANASGMSICDVDCFDRRDASDHHREQRRGRAVGRDERRHHRGQPMSATSSRSRAVPPGR